MIKCGYRDTPVATLIGHHCTRKRVNMILELTSEVAGSFWCFESKPICHLLKARESLKKGIYRQQKKAPLCLAKLSAKKRSYLQKKNNNEISFLMLLISFYKIELTKMKFSETRL